MKRMLPILWAFLFGALVVYVALTYVTPLPVRPATAETRLFATLLQVVAGVEFFVGLVMERVKLRGAQNPGEVQTAFIVSAAMGEAIAIYGLLLYFMTGVRHWEFFAVSAVYLVGLLLRLPNFHLKIDELNETLP